MASEIRSPYVGGSGTNDEVMKDAVRLERLEEKRCENAEMWV